MDKGHYGNSAQVLGDFSHALKELVAQVGSNVVLVDSEEAQARSGIRWDDHHILTGAAYAQANEVVRVRIITSKAGAAGEKSYRDLQATVVGRDPATGFVLLESAESLPIGDIPRRAEPAAVGELVVSVALPSSDGVEAKIGMIRCVGGPYTAARGGVVSGYIQTDGNLFPGFAGAPVVDAAGNLVGVHSPAALSGGDGSGAGLIIPIDFVVEVATRIAEHRIPVRAYLGVRSQEVEISAQLQQKLGREQSYGLLVVQVEPGTPAEKAGLVTGDILVSLAGNQLASHDELLNALDAVAVGSEVEARILRGGELKEVKVTLTAAPEQPEWSGRGPWGPWSGHRGGHRGGWGGRHMRRWFTNGTAG